MTRHSSAIVFLTPCVSVTLADDGPYLWLEDIQHEDALVWDSKIE